MWKEFRAFITRGNVVDLAVAVVIGAAFTAIVNSLVRDIIMPGVGILLSGVDLDTWKVVLQEAVIDASTAEVITEEVAIRIGAFITAIIQFVIVALVIFLVVKGINTLRERRKKEEAAAPEEPAARPEDVVLLEEIRDLLKKRDA